MQLLKIPAILQIHPNSGSDKVKAPGFAGGFYIF
jgi:hypothetical protein